MYKVFVDHKPIIFVSREEIPADGLIINFEELPVEREELKPLLKNVGLNAPLYILCNEVKQDFKSYFKQYKKIKAAGGIVR